MGSGRMQSKAERRSVDDEEERFAEIENFADFAAAEFRDGKIEGGERGERH